MSPGTGPLENLEKPAEGNYRGCEVDSAMRAMRRRRKEGKGSLNSSSTAAQIWAALKNVIGPESLERGRWRRERDSKALGEEDIGRKSRRAKWSDWAEWWVGEGLRRTTIGVVGVSN